MGKPKYTNFTDLAVDSLVINDDAAQTLTGSTGTITRTSGVAVLNRGGGVTATLALPSVDDDGETLTIISLNAVGHTITLASGTFGGSGTGYTTITFTGAIGDSVQLVAYGGLWYILQLNHASIA